MRVTFRCHISVHEGYKRSACKDESALACVLYVQKRDKADRLSMAPLYEDSLCGDLHAPGCHAQCAASHAFTALRLVKPPHNQHVQRKALPHVCHLAAEMHDKYVACSPLDKHSFASQAVSRARLWPHEYGRPLLSCRPPHNHSLLPKVSTNICRANSWRRAGCRTLMRRWLRLLLLLFPPCSKLAHIRILLVVSRLGCSEQGHVQPLGNALERTPAQLVNQVRSVLETLSQCITMTRSQWS